MQRYISARTGQPICQRPLKRRLRLVLALMIGAGAGSSGIGLPGENTAFAQPPLGSELLSPLNRAARFLGVGYSDGYHASQPRRECFLQDMPPQSAWMARESQAHRNADWGSGFGSQHVPAGPPIWFSGHPQQMAPAAAVDGSSMTAPRIGYPSPAPIPPQPPFVDLPADTGANGLDSFSGANAIPQSSVLDRSGEAEALPAPNPERQRTGLDESPSPSDRVPESIPSPDSDGPRSVPSIERPDLQGGKGANSSSQPANIPDYMPRSPLDPMAPETSADDLQQNRPQLNPFAETNQQQPETDLQGDATPRAAITPPSASQPNASQPQGSPPPAADPSREPAIESAPLDPNQPERFLPPSNGGPEDDLLGAYHRSSPSQYTPIRVFEPVAGPRLFPPQSQRTPQNELRPVPTNHSPSAAPAPRSAGRIVEPRRQR
jgi:hypothetical protein